MPPKKRTKYDKEDEVVDLTDELENVKLELIFAQEQVDKCVKLKKDLSDAWTAITKLNEDLKAERHLVELRDERIDFLESVIIRQDKEYIELQEEYNELRNIFTSSEFGIEAQPDHEIVLSDGSIDFNEEEDDDDQVLP